MVRPDDRAEVTLACIEQADRAAVEQLIAASNRTPRPFFIVLGRPPRPYGMRILTERTSGYLIADDELATTLPIALRAVALGLDVQPRAFREARRRPELSPREKQVLAMVVLDLSNAEIARRLSLGEASVKNVLTAAFAKLGVRSRAAAAELILDEDAGLGLGILRITPTQPPA